MNKLLCVIVSQNLLKFLNHWNQVFKILWRQWPKGNIFEEELKKIDIEGEKVSKDLNNLLFAKLHMQEKCGVQGQTWGKCSIFNLFEEN